jgi:lysophospholipase L1-like esterase
VLEQVARAGLRQPGAHDHEHIDAWLEKLNPEAAVIMFGTNDLGEVPAKEYEEKTRVVVERCLAGGTIPLLTTLPPRSGRLKESRHFAEIVRRIAREQKVPLVDYFEAIVNRRPDDWDGTLPKFKEAGAKDVYAVPTLISGDGVHPSNPQQHRDFSEEALRSNGFGLRNYVTLLSYAEVIRWVLRAEK